jgi:hypothetical protein
LGAPLHRDDHRGHLLRAVPPDRQELSAVAAIEHVFAGVPTSDYAAALPWYTRLFGRPPDVIVKEDESMWELASGTWVYVVADPGRAGNALLTVMVDDLDAHVAALRERGAEPGAIETTRGKFRRSELNDPDGNQIAFAEALSPQS